VRSGPAPRVALLALGAALIVAVSGCGSPVPTPGTSGAASPVPAQSGRPATLASPVTGRLTKIDAEGLTKVKGFTLRLDDGTEVPFTIGVLENGAQFPPGHLAEHMASSSAVKVFFRDEGGAHVVYRLEDGE